MAIDCTECLEGVLQLLEPDTPVEFTVLGGTSTSPALAESGIFPLVEGVNTYFVPFITRKSSATYSYDLIVENTSDSVVLSLEAQITQRTIDGFSVLLDGLPDSANYRLRWSVLVSTVS